MRRNKNKIVVNESQNWQRSNWKMKSQTLKIEFETQDENEWGIAKQKLKTEIEKIETDWDRNQIGIGIANPKIWGKLR